ncbi:anti-virulence regulator CigR family protein [Achromobacter sp.]|uniref:anti-virulence regulator CigR family protein n=1 Tax=Achromobacter sp. TaxID=134375 RepID=UPI002899BFF6|nr:anti-virulence regulator CigR family protein [Achromobacter sp.]
MSFRAKPIFIAAISCIFLTTGAFAAPPEGKGKPDNPGQGQNKGGGKNNSNGNGNGSAKGHAGNGGGANSKTNSDSPSVTLRFAGITVSTARTYAHEYGLSGYSQLPPGIRKNLARGKPLPPGIAKKMVPGPMLARLPAYSGYEWRIAGSDLVLVAIATAVVADVLLDVFD